MITTFFQKISTSRLGRFGFALALFVGCLNIQLQAQDYQWALAIEKISGFDSEINDINTDQEGNIFITGYIWGTLDFDGSGGTAFVSPVGVGQYDIFLAKYDSSGNFLWAFAMGAGTTDEGFALTTDDAGNVYMCGGFGGKVDFDPSPDSSFLEGAGGFLTKYDTDGNLQWVIETGGWGLDISFENTGTVLLTGGYNNSDFDPSIDTFLISGTGMFIARYDTAGDFIWAKGMRTPNDASICYAHDIDSENNILLAGTFIDSVDFDPSANDSYITGASPNLSYAFVAKYDDSGNYLWARSVGSTKITGGSSESCGGYGVAVDNGNNIYISGQFRDTIDFDHSLGEVILTGPVFGNMFISKYNAGGDHLWARSIGNDGGNGGHFAYGLVINDNNNVILLGQFKDSLDISLIHLTANGNGLLIAKYTSNGDPLWAFGLEVQAFINPTSNGLTLTESSKLLIGAGLSSSSSDLDPSPNTASFLGDMFIAKYRDTIPFVSVFTGESHTDSIKVYPNPGDGDFLIQHPRNAKIRVFNSSGKLIHSEDSGIDHSRFSLVDKSSGIYYVWVESHGNQYCRLVVKY